MRSKISSIDNLEELRVGLHKKKIEDTSKEYSLPGWESFSGASSLWSAPHQLTYIICLL